MFNQKSVLARLLANENITVQQGNYHTAYFDVTKRELGLPLWKEMSKDVYDMIVGHEVAHALETPTNFFEWKDADKVPHSWLNVVEDIRIEKKILRKYPGLVANFKRGYTELMLGELDLFGMQKNPVEKMGFMDRLNIRAKARDMIAVPFAADEMPYVAKAMAVETYDEVVAVCLEIREWLKEKADDKKNQEQENTDGESIEKTVTIGVISDESQEADGEETDVTPDVIIDMRSENPEETEEDKKDSDSDNGKDEAETKEETDKGAATEPESGESDQESETDIAYNQNQKYLVDNSVVNVRGLSRADALGRILPYSEVAQDRKSKNTHLKNTNFDLVFPESQFATFLKDTKQVVNLMVKEFEMRKAAFRSLRARSSTKGSLDVNKLHKYQYDDMLFKQVTNLADAKNHGMVMLIDYSGSMSNSISNVIKQTLALLMFCKRVGIPFEVYSFTSTTDYWKGKVKPTTNHKAVHVQASELGIIKLFSSDMTKKEYDEAFRMMFWQTVSRSAASRYEALSNTPLNTALMVMQYVISDFRAKYKVQKMNFITLTDGDSNPLSITNGGSDVPFQPNHKAEYYAVEVNGKIIKMEKSLYGRVASQQVTASFVKAIRDMDVVCVNYFLADGYSVNYEIARSLQANKTSEKFTEAVKQIRKEGAVVLDDNLGYNRRFIIGASGAQMGGVISDLDFDEDASVKQIAKAFTKSNGSKKKSKIITQKFAEMIA